MFGFFMFTVFGVKFHVKNVGLTGLTETAWSHVNLTLYMDLDVKSEIKHNKSNQIMDLETLEC